MPLPPPLPAIRRSLAGLAGLSVASRLPSVCAICGGFGPGRLCATCLARFGAPRPRCARCALPLEGAGGSACEEAGDEGRDAAPVEARPPALPTCGACLSRPPPFDAAVAAVDYRAPWDRLLADFKFRDAPELAGPLAARLLDAVRRRPDLEPELVVPVPLARARLVERGHNQAWELARRLVPGLAGPVGRAPGAAPGSQDRPDAGDADRGPDRQAWPDRRGAGDERARRDTADGPHGHGPGVRPAVRGEPALVVRLRDTPHQLALPPGERAGNVRGAFAVEPARAGEVAGRRVLLVDDVMTTGSTAGEIARVLHAAGAAFVAVAVVARVPRPGED